RLRRVGPVRGVLLDVRAELAAHRAFRRLRGIGGTHQITPALDGVLALEDPDEHRTRGHEPHEVSEEGTLGVHGVEPLRLVDVQLPDATGHDREATGFDHRKDLTEHARAHRVGLDHEERAFRHCSLPAFRRTSCIVTPRRAGLGDSVTPTASSAAIFSAAAPLPPAMMAPACPMRLPLGAVWPAMKLTTGLVTCAVMKAAASSSAVPPIWPIMITASVPASPWTRRRRSMTPVRMIGSPPMPMHVDWPRPSWVSWDTPASWRV